MSAAPGLVGLLPWVAAGGACGAVARFTLTALLPGSAPGLFSWGTLSVNVTGCFAIGLLAGTLSGTAWFESVGRAFLVAGLLGAFTTFSAFSMDVLDLGAHGKAGLAGVYAVATVVLCLGAAAAGERIGGLVS